MKKMTGRDLSLYLAVLLVFFAVVNIIQGMDRQDEPSYSQIRTYFEQERVKRFQVKDDTLTLELRGEGDSTTTVTCQLGDYQTFYQDLNALIDVQRQKGIIEDYDIRPGVESAWW